MTETDETITATLAEEVMGWIDEGERWRTGDKGSIHKSFFIPLDDLNAVWEWHKARKGGER